MASALVAAARRAAEALRASLRLPRRRRCRAEGPDMRATR